MAGMSMEPTAATVAVPEPDIAAKKRATTIITYPRPPYTEPINILATFINRFDIPPSSIAVPARTNRGMVSSVNFSTVDCKIDGIDVMGNPAVSRVKALERPRAMAMGTFSTIKAARVTKRITVLVISPHSPFPFQPFSF